MSDETKLEFIDGTDFAWNDISSEEFRVYKFSDTEIRIDGPYKLNVSRSGGHRVFDIHGISHYIPSGWRHLSWKARPGQPNFVK